MQIKNVIDEFVEMWEQKALSYYLRILDEYKEMNYNYNKIDNPHNLVCPMRTPARTQEFNRMEKYLTDKLGKNYDLIRAVRAQDEEYIRKMIKTEGEIKKARFIYNIKEKAGNVIDGKLYLENGEINGVVIGDKNKVSVRTISAGGYNIQCFHYRTLVKVMK